MGRPPLESRLYVKLLFILLQFLDFFQSLEINAAISETYVAYKGVDTWAKSEKPPFSLNFAPMRPVMYKTPKGVVLIISPFNYPLWLAVTPLVCKPSLFQNI